ncbi:3-oxoadipate enol-lactonase [Roseivivax isoporae]|uniref:3-oxoadipate enol-lactonase n=1 Tax=Roseivivax isoporae LMG 25204 TaxID=1449351 RepID=X7FFQ2_9RHOB|nr:3-oxoadipate enol-lactonase [Roseivivax isoporae]ETX30896.1 3-oxoadipate enol-lactonase [Roseivivax isoporae LMG 25204]
MQIAEVNGTRLHYRIDGPADGAPVVFSNSLGTDLRLWDAVLPHLPAGLRILRYDKRGHGLSEAPKGPYSMGMLVSDVEALMDHAGMTDAVFVGLSIGGMIAQGLATKRHDLVRAAVLSNTGAKIGTREMWADRIAAVEAGGIAALADQVLERWFSARFRATPEFHAWRNMLLRQPREGYLGCCHAIAGADFFTPTAALRLPVLGIAGSEDGSTPPDLVRETAELVPGSQVRLMRGVGHLPCVEAPEDYASILTGFLKAQGHG